MRTSWPGALRLQRWGGAVIAVAVVGAGCRSPRRAARRRWRRSSGSLRIAKPQAVEWSVSPDPPARTAPGRKCRNMVGGMLGKTVDVALDEADRPAARSRRRAGKLAGFAAHLPRARSDAPTIVVTGAHAIEMTGRGPRPAANHLRRSREEGRTVVPASVEGLEGRGANAAGDPHAVRQLVPRRPPALSRTSYRARRRHPRTMRTASCSSRVLRSGRTSPPDWTWDHSSKSHSNSPA